MNSCELVASIEKDGFSFIKSCSFAQVDDTLLMGLDYIRFYHKDMEALMCAEGEYLTPALENGTFALIIVCSWINNSASYYSFGLVHLRVRRFDLNNRKTWSKSNNPNIAWQIENHDIPLSSKFYKNLVVSIKHYIIYGYCVMSLSELSDVFQRSF